MILGLERLLVVADTTPLNYLVQLGAIELLELLFHRVLVPRAVIQELSHNKSVAALQAWVVTLPPWIEVVDDVRLDMTLSQTLGAGERDAISLAVQLGASLLLIDEVAGRRAAQERNLPVAGTLAILLEGSLRQNTEFSASLKELRRLGFRMTDELERAMLARYETARRLN